MAHSIPKELRGEERYFTLPVVNIHFGKKAVIYNGTVTLLAVLIGKVSNFVVFLVVFLVLNIIAYPLATAKVSKNKFDGGNVPIDKFMLRKYKYKKFNKKIYIRRRGE